MRMPIAFDPQIDLEPLDTHAETIFFTICSWNYLAYAITLHDSLIRTNGPAHFFVAICDSKNGFDSFSLPFPLIFLDELGIPSLKAMAAKYNITELNTAIKPFVFAYLFEKHPNSVVVYMDPDILVASELTELREAFLNGADCVLTPHLLEPNEFANFSDQNMLLYGIYNLGFCALRATPKVRRVVSWWARRLESHCVIDLSNGLFVDQKWADLLPAFIERTQMLHHCGYNVAYWNLIQRRVRKTEKGWIVNDRPLRFFHFSGNRIGEAQLFSRHSNEPSLNIGDAAILFEDYANAVKSNGHFYYRTFPYGFDWNGQGQTNLHTPKSEQAPPLPTDSFDGLKTAAGENFTIPHLPLMPIQSFAAYMKSKKFLEDLLGKRAQYESGAAPQTESVFSFPGQCVVCGKPSKFQASYMYSSRKFPDGRPMPNWREHLSCETCGFANRLRAFLHILFQEFKPTADSKIYISEQATRMFAWLSRQFPNLVGSEYISADLQPGAIVNGIHHENGSMANGIRHEDLQKLSFPDNSFDFVFSLDVLEHVPDYCKAFGEVYRCLNSAGSFIFSVPFCVDQYKNLVMATLGKDGEITHLGEPEYHGNPVDPERGSLCFRYFAWEALKDLLTAGFASAECWFYWSRQYAYLGEPQLLVVARKGADYVCDRRPIQS